jgi:predicted phage tail protein
MKIVIRLFFCICISATVVGSDISDERAAYLQVVQERAARIVDSIELGEAEARRDAVITVIANQYRDLNDLQEAEEQALEDLKESVSGVSQKASDAAEAAIRLTLSNETHLLHYAFLGRLSALLNPEQVDAVKDGMTYSVMPRTFVVYQELLPEMTEEQRVHVYSLLAEARELAMDAGSSKAKHRVFGKYKGKINNYLSGLGYDLKAAEQRMWDRKKAEPRQ